MVNFSQKKFLLFFFTINKCAVNGNINYYAGLIVTKIAEYFKEMIYSFLNVFMHKT